MVSLLPNCPSPPHSKSTLFGTHRAASETLERTDPF